MWRATGSSPRQAANLLCSLPLPLHPFSRRSLTHPPSLYYLTVNITSFHQSKLLFFSLSCLSLSLTSRLYSEVFNLHALPCFSHYSSIFTLSINLPHLIILLCLLCCLCCFFFFYRCGDYSNTSSRSASAVDAQRNSGTSEHLFQSSPFLCSVVLCAQFAF